VLSAARLQSLRRIALLRLSAVACRSQVSGLRMTCIDDALRCCSAGPFTGR
jgi:hypothetical protein